MLEGLHLVKNLKNYQQSNFYKKITNQNYTTTEILLDLIYYNQQILFNAYSKKKIKPKHALTFKKEKNKKQKGYNVPANQINEKIKKIQESN